MSQIQKTHLHNTRHEMQMGYPPGNEMAESLTITDSEKGPIKTQRFHLWPSNKLTELVSIQQTKRQILKQRKKNDNNRGCFQYYCEEIRMFTSEVRRVIEGKWRDDSSG